MRQNPKNQQELLFKKKKKSRKGRFVRVILVLVLFIIIISFAFYGIQNPSFIPGIIQSIKSFYLSTENPPGGITDSSSAGNGSGGTGEVNETQESGGSAVENEDVAGETEKPAGLWERILNFFKIGAKKQDENFPSSIELKVYFAALGSEEKFSFEKRLIIAGDPAAAVKNAVGELLKGPAKSFNFAVVPPGTELLDVEIYENFAKLDFSGRFLENSLESGILDEYVIYTIVNTVTQIPGIDGVIFLIEGKRIKMYGNVDLSIPAIKNEKFIDEVENKD